MRIIHCLALVGLLACGPGRSSFARFPGTQATFERGSQDTKALDIADKAIAAAGGADRWKAAKQLRWKQVVTNDGKQVLAGEQAWDRWNGRHHARARREEGDVVVMRPLYENGGSAYLDTGEKLKKMEGGTVESLALAQERWEFDTAALFMPFLMEEPGTKLAYEGEAPGDDGKPRDVIKVTFDPKDKTRTSIYRVAINRDTHMIDRIEIQKPGKGENERLGYGVSDYKDGGGIKYPSKLQNLGLKGEVLTFSDLTISEPDENLFVPPL